MEEHDLERQLGIPPQRALGPEADVAILVVGQRLESSGKVAPDFWYGVVASLVALAETSSSVTACAGATISARATIDVNATYERRTRPSRRLVATLGQL